MPPVVQQLLGADDIVGVDPGDLGHERIGAAGQDHHIGVVGGDDVSIDLRRNVDVDAELCDLAGVVLEEARNLGLARRTRRDIDLAAEPIVALPDRDVLPALVGESRRGHTGRAAADDITRLGSDAAVSATSTRAPSPG